jgi:CheY-like chemotaxis protein
MTKRIVLAEDTRCIRDAVSFLLANRGFQVIPVDNGKDALDKTRSTRPDLLILDSDMPEKSGYDVFRALKYDDACKDIPVLFLVAGTDAADLTRSVPPAEFLVPKPFTAHDLLQRVIKILSDAGPA